VQVAHRRKIVRVAKVTSRARMEAVKLAQSDTTGLRVWPRAHLVRTTRTADMSLALIAVHHAQLSALASLAAPTEVNVLAPGDRP
jgi:hypothetical protein